MGRPEEKSSRKNGKSKNNFPGQRRQYGQVLENREKAGIAGVVLKQGLDVVEKGEVNTGWRRWRSREVMS